MTEPIKPRNEVTLGGVAFDANQAESYGTYKIPYAKAGNCYINFTNGTKVEYPQQPTDFTLGIFRQEKPAIEELSPRNFRFNNINGLEIQGKTQGTYLSYDVYNSNGLTINTEGTDSFSTIYIQDSQNVTVNANTSCGCSCDNEIGIFDSNNVNVETPSGHVFSYDSENINITTGSKRDCIKIKDSNNFTVDTGDGNDVVEIVTEDDSVLDSREVGLPQGSVKMNDGDTLTIEKGGDYNYICSDSEHVGDSLIFTNVTTSYRSVAKVKGNGVHNVAQTPAGAFETTRTTRITKERILYTGFEEILIGGEVLSDQTVKEIVKD